MSSQPSPVNATAASAKPVSGELLTGKALVEALASLGLGPWTPAAVRQWIREEPPCPIGAPAQQGAPHRYRVADVLDWLKARAQRERVKGYTSADGASLIDRIDAAQRRASAGAGVGVGADARPAPSSAIQAELPVAPKALQAVTASEFSEDEIASLNDLELMRQILRGRDPRNWESAERALRLHRENRIAENAVVPVEDLEQTLATQALAMRNACEAVVVPLAQRIPDASTFDQRCHLIRAALDELLQQLASTDTVELAIGGAA